jgi:hypothetical protein
LGEYRAVQFRGRNNDNVFGYVVKPADFKRDQKYPVAFVIHGGPQGSMANVWHWRWNAQTFAGAGYGVVMIDFHGSTGLRPGLHRFDQRRLGRQAARGSEARPGGRAQAIPVARRRRLRARRLVRRIHDQLDRRSQWPDRFKCLVTHDGIFDNRSMYYSTEELWFPEWENGGPEYLNPAGYAKFNPIDYVAQWKTPMLVIHGQLDYRVPYAQGLACSPPCSGAACRASSCTSRTRITGC